MPQLPLTDESFREVASRYATGVVVVTTTADGFDHAMTATSFATVSLDPMLALVCVEQETRFHDALCGSGGPDSGGNTWGVSVLTEQAVPAASWFATKGRPLHGQFDRFPHYRGPQTGTILLEDSIATMELRTTGLIPSGDHTIALGEVLSLSVSEELVQRTPAEDSGWPLTYWARRYRNLSR
ncbi:MAG: flavin reductase family protein [Candidatus Nanopelagicales bacterium]